MNEPNPPQRPSRSSLQITLDWRIVSLALFITAGVLLFLWQPWNKVSAKTITVRGEASVKAVPDEYQFTPIFQDADVAKVTAAGNEAVVQLKKLGVNDADIKTTVNSAADSGKPEPADQPGTARPLIYPAPSAKSTYQITATTKSKETAQKIADYLATTTATGQVTPYATLSKATQSKIDLQARSQASDDAKAKAEVMAKQLGGRIGKVVTISEEGSGIYPYAVTNGASGVAEDTRSSPIVQPGTDEVSYSFTVVFELK